MSIFLPLLATTTVLTLLRALQGTKRGCDRCQGICGSDQSTGGPAALGLSCPSMAEWESRGRLQRAVWTRKNAWFCPLIAEGGLCGERGGPGAHLGACTFRLPPMAVLADRACMMVVCRCKRRQGARREAQGDCPPAQPEGSHQAHPCCARWATHETQSGLPRTSRTARIKCPYCTAPGRAAGRGSSTAQSTKGACCVYQAVNRASSTSINSRFVCGASIGLAVARCQPHGAVVAAPARARKGTREAHKNSLVLETDRGCVVHSSCTLSASLLRELPSNFCQVSSQAEGDSERAA